MHQLQITFTGAVLDLKVELEGKEVGLYFDGVSEWTRTLEHFKINGKLDILMLCKGVNGTAWNLKITVDQDGSKTYSGAIKKGYSFIADQLEMPLKN